MQFKEILNNSPIIAAVKDMRGLVEALDSEVEIIFVLFGDIISIKEISIKIKEKNKKGILHIDLVEGLTNKDIVVKYIKNETEFEGIITTKSSLIKAAKQYGLFTIQRFFIFDTISFNNSKSHIVSECDAIEILPGVIPKVIKNMAICINKPIVVGGLIENKEEVILALNAGATSVSTSKKNIWDM
ncbi:glycerol-3-phosphate responsive antiterminator [Clostridioides difficile]